MTLDKRDAFPDLLRGFALLGIAVVNVPFQSIDTFMGSEGSDLTQPVNALTAGLVMALFQAKFYLLFSFLFGYSAHYVINSELRKRGRWIGRSVGLIGLGILHFVFLFHGDILFLYGLFGLVLLALYFKKEKTIRRWAWGIYIFVVVNFFAISSLTLLGEWALAVKGKALPLELTFNSGLDSALANGSFIETVAPRFELWAVAAPNAFLLQGPLVFVAFLVGVLAARKNALASENVNPLLMKRLLTWGLALGLPLQVIGSIVFITNLLGANSAGIYLFSISLNFLSAPLLSAAYVALLWYASERLKLSLLSAAGRVSLSVYLGQSVVFSLIFSNWGFDQFGKLNVFQVTLVAVATWLALALLAKLLLRRFKKGPFEYLLTNFSKSFERRT